MKAVAHQAGHSGNRDKQDRLQDGTVCYRTPRFVGRAASLLNDDRIVGVTIVNGGLLSRRGCALSFLSCHHGPQRTCRATTTQSCAHFRRVAAEGRAVGNANALVRHCNANGCRCQAHSRALTYQRIWSEMATGGTWKEGMKTTAVRRAGNLSQAQTRR